MMLLPLIFVWSRAPMKYGLASKTAVLCFFALSAATLSVRCQVPGLETHAIAADQWDDELTPEADQPPKAAAGARLREGSRLPPSVGRFFRSGRRWVFEQEAPEKELAYDALPAPDTVPQTLAPQKPPEAASAEAGIAQPAGAPQANSSQANSSQADSPRANSQQRSGAIQLRVLENLALQRVVDAIAQDSSDVRWSVTGEVTEFGGENWLLLSTIFRAPSNPDNAHQPAVAAPALVTTPAAEDRAPPGRSSTSGVKGYGAATKTGS